ncbi:MAG: 3-isopropylmalate dehydrogenase [Alcaligenaceae bacterium]
MKIAVLAGDGVGPEVTAQAVKVLRATIGDASLQLTEAPVGGAGLAAAGDPLPAATLAIAKSADAILFGSAGLPGDETTPYAMRAGASLLRLRKELDLFANYRPIFMFPELIGASSLKPHLVEGLDLLILRELSSDIYFGEPRGVSTNAQGVRVGINTMYYTEPEIERIIHVAFKAARQRKGKVCSVDKANVLDTMQLWREVAERVSKQYPDVEYSNALVDAFVMMMMRQPKQFDVVVTGNMFGDIVSDAAAMLTGSIGMLPSASLSPDGRGLYEPVHGTAPDIAGKNIANPLASILSAAMMLDYSFKLPEQSARIKRAVAAVLAQGYRTADIFEAGTKAIGTAEMGDAVVAALKA